MVERDLPITRQNELIVSISSQSFERVSKPYGNRCYLCHGTVILGVSKQLVPAWTTLLTDILPMLTASQPAGPGIVAT